MSKIEPEDLLLWRRKRGLKQYELGALLHKSRNTICHWERGVTPIPAWVGDALGKLAMELGAKEIPKPQFVTPESAPQLYVKYRNAFNRRGIHPAMLMETGFLAEARQKDEAGNHLPLPFEILESSGYLEAKARWLASGKTVPGESL